MSINLVSPELRHYAAVASLKLSDACVCLRARRQGFLRWPALSPPIENDFVIDRVSIAGRMDRVDRIGPAGIAAV